MMRLAIDDPRHVWLTADLHLAPEGGRTGTQTIRRSRRPFDGCWEARERILDGIRQVVGTGDILVILGDVVSLDVTDDNVESVIGDLPRQDSWLVLGNHDANVTEGKWRSLFGEGRVGDYLEIVVTTMENDTDGYPLRALCFHYPLSAWNGDRFGNLHLHGHNHFDAGYNDLQRMMGRRVYDVGVDANGFLPVRLSDILTHMGVPAPVWQPQHHDMAVGEVPICDMPQDAMLVYNR